MYALLWHLDFEKECQNTWAYFSLQLQIQTKQQQQKQSLRFKLQCTKHATECLCWWENTRSFSSRQYDQQLFFLMENNKIFHENGNLSIRWKGFNRCSPDTVCLKCCGVSWVLLFLFFFISDFMHHIYLLLRCGKFVFIRQIIHMQIQWCLVVVLFFMQM